MPEDEHDPAATDHAAAGAPATDPAAADASGVVPDAPWLHGTWQVRHVDGAGVDALTERPWLAFDGDGVVFGDAGVNRVRGTWRLDGAHLGFGPVVATRMAGTPEATAVERAVLDVLASGGTVVRSTDGVEVTGPAGRGMSLVRPSS